MPSEFGIDRAIFRAMIPAWASLGFGMNKMISEFKAAGFASFRRTVMLSDIRGVLDMFLGESRFRGQPSDEPIGLSRMVQTPLGKDARYRVFGWATYRDIETGAEFEKKVSFYTDDRLSPGAYFQPFADYADEIESETGTQVTGLDVRAVQHNLGWSY